ncbi:MAG: TIGR03905 family TSCPD domain-containing protein [Clostridia bacterium]|nr:TIGR03905 family TSCPD domain-containing protein [Clostridia bacterium]
MKFTYKTNGVCSRSIDIEIENDTIVSVSYMGGCNGNLKGIGSLVVGMKVDDVIEKLSGIKCGFKDTSCPAQLALALIEYKNQKG